MLKSTHLFILSLVLALTLASCKGDQSGQTVTSIQLLQVSPANFKAGDKVTCFTSEDCEGCECLFENQAGLYPEYPDIAVSNTGGLALQKNYAPAGNPAGTNPLTRKVPRAVAPALSMLTGCPAGQSVNEGCLLHVTVTDGSVTSNSINALMVTSAYLTTCQSDSACHSDEKCLTDNSGGAGICVSVDTFAKINPDFNPTPVLKNEGESCTTSNDCSGTLVCTLGTCTKPVVPGGTKQKGSSCALLTECASGLTCNSLGQCDTPVVVGGNCKSPKDCGDSNLYSCTLNQCKLIPKIPAGGKCSYSVNCAAGLGCFNNVCSKAGETQACTKDSDCVAGFRCGTQAGLNECFKKSLPGQSCTSTFNCDEGYTCASGASGNVCTKICKNDSECAGGICMSGDSLGFLAPVCGQKLANGTTCNADHDCQSGTCNGAGFSGTGFSSGQCGVKGGDNASCTVDTECAADSFCSGSPITSYHCTKKVAAGASCKDDNGCQSSLYCDKGFMGGLGGSLSTGTCAVKSSSMCKSDADCANGSYCSIGFLATSGSCNVKKAAGTAGASCATANDCSSPLTCEPSFSMSGFETLCSTTPADWDMKVIWLAYQMGTQCLNAEAPANLQAAISTICTPVFAPSNGNWDYVDASGNNVSTSKLDYCTKQVTKYWQSNNCPATP